jgi:polyketide biosynthesis acyl carrier protein
MARTREDVAAVVAGCIRDILMDVDDEKIAAARSLKDLGANSIDRVEIASLAMEKLRLTFPLSELAGVNTIAGLVDALFARSPR